jgi:hypothetical protein
VSPICNRKGSRWTTQRKAFSFVRVCNARFISRIKEPNKTTNFVISIQCLVWIHRWILMLSIIVAILSTRQRRPNYGPRATFGPPKCFMGPELLFIYKKKLNAKVNTDRLLGRGYQQHDNVCFSCLNISWVYFELLSLLLMQVELWKNPREHLVCPATNADVSNRPA